MTLVSAATSLVERLPLPDPLTRSGISWLVGRTRRKLAQDDPEFERMFAAEMDRRGVAEFAKAAREQHYDVSPAFFILVLGPRRKYSSCLYESGATTLAEAEDRALAETCAHAELADGQTILELGCGWGSLSLWMAETYPAARITAVSNSASQRAYIQDMASLKGITNLTVITADMNSFAPEGKFDRIVSVEMFEHMSNWRALLGRIRGWTAPGGKLFLHVFSHRSRPYRFDQADKEDWIAQHFFTGGVMPSHGLIRQFGDLFVVEQDWTWNGLHYQRTAMDWLANFDAQSEAVNRVLRSVYGAEAALWGRRWRLFFLATAGLFGHAGGTEWGVSHYRLSPA